MLKTDQPREYYDVIVVGSGPSGSTLAYELARKGIEVAILEREKLPRPKLCGGGITLKAAHLLPFDISPIVHCTVQRLILLYRGEERLVIEDGQPLLYTSMRAEFDYFLAEKAFQEGVAVLENQSVREIQEKEGQYEIRTQSSRFRARVVVGADGANSQVARSQGLRLDPFLLLALEGEASARSQSNLQQADTILVDWGSIRNGYGWIFPKKQHTTIGVGAPVGLTPEIKRYYDWLIRRSIEDPLAYPKIKGHHLPVRKNRMPIQRNRVVLVGDAAGLVEPFTGEGIYYAIRSAQIAAEEIFKVQSGESPDFREYEQHIDDELMPEIVTGQVLSGLFATFPRFALSLFAHNQKIQKFLCQAIRGEVKLSDCGPLLGGYQILLAAARRLAYLDNRLNIFAAVTGYQPAIHDRERSPKAAALTR
jgi:geranylgeranyl reductase family protein